MQSAWRSVYIKQVLNECLAFRSLGGGGMAKLASSGLRDKTAILYNLRSWSWLKWARGQEGQSHNCSESVEGLL